MRPRPFNGWRLDRIHRAGGGTLVAGTLYSPCGWFRDFPLRHDFDGRTVYDWPERIPHDVRAWVARVLAIAQRRLPPERTATAWRPPQRP